MSLSYFTVFISPLSRSITCDALLSRRVWGRFTASPVRAVSFGNVLM